MFKPQQSIHQRADPGPDIILNFPPSRQTNSNDSAICQQEKSRYKKHSKNKNMYVKYLSHDEKINKYFNKKQQKKNYSNISKKYMYNVKVS